MLAYIAQAIGFGFAAGTSLGPFTMYIISTTLTYTWRKGILVIFSPLLVDIPIILVMTFLLAQLPDWGVRLIQLAGGSYTVWLGWVTWRTVRQGDIQIDVQPVDLPANTLAIMLRGLLMNALSPGPYIFWGTMTGPLLRRALDESVWHGLGFVVSFYVTFLSLLAMWVFGFDRLRRIDRQFTKILLSISAVLLVILGISLFLGGLFA